MENLSGCLTAKLADGHETYEDYLIEEINQRINPPRPVGPGDVHIRAMYIVSDQINSQGGCFAEDELDRLTYLMVDSPVMVGHQRDSLPLARNFMAQKVLIDGRLWVKSYFYWMKDSDGAEDLKNNIDGGIYKECSISFLFAFPECSICGRDIRECHHIPFREYEVETGQTEIAHFKYRNIERVLETSLVFRGAVPDTRITDQLSPDKAADFESRRPLMATHFFKVSETTPEDAPDHHYGGALLRFDTPGDFVPDSSATNLYLAPYQPGIELHIISDKGTAKFETSTPLTETIHQYLNKILPTIDDQSFVIDAVLYAVKGRQRMDGKGLIQVMESGNKLHRLRLKICDAAELNGEKLTGLTYQKRLEKLEAVFGNTQGGLFEIRKYDCLTDGAWDRDRIIEDCRHYNFGIEVVSENSQGSLARNVLTPRKMIPAIVERAKADGRGLVRCNLKPFDGGPTITGVASVENTGLRPGAVVLLVKSAAPGRCRRIVWTLADILLQGTDHIVTTPDIEAPDDDRNLYVVHDADQLLIFFRENGQWQAVTLHHFSTRLFERGRRFVADMMTDKDRLPVRTDGETIPLRSVKKSGKLILLQLEKATTLFGPKTKLWLRPVILDGRERFLFYAGGVSRLPEEL